MTKTKRPPIRIDFNKNPWDRKVRRLGMTFTAKVVAEQTGLSVSQVAGRRRKAGISSNLAFRRGLTTGAKNMLKVAEARFGSADKLQTMMRRMLSKSKRVMMAY